MRRGQKANAAIGRLLHARYIGRSCDLIQGDPLGRHRSHQLLDACSLWKSGQHIRVLSYIQLWDAISAGSQLASLIHHAHPLPKAI